MTPGEGEDAEASKEAVPFMGVLGILVLINIAAVFIYCFFK